jgi:hypothetical protein
MSIASWLAMARGRERYIWLPQQFLGLETKIQGVTSRIWDQSNVK